MLENALWYARRLGPVFPLAPRGKMPLFSKEQGGHGACDATTDEQQIREWWGQYPDANIGLTTDHLAVVDVDPRNGGDEVWGEVVAPHGWPKSLEAQTGSGGVHLVFQRLDFEPKCKPWGGVDIVTGPHRYIVAAPSIHPCGGRYQWVERMAPQPMPAWLANLLRRDEPTRIRQTTNDERRDMATAFQRACRYVDKCAPAVQGQNGSTATLTVVIKLATNFPELGESELWNLLVDYSSRCLPPWSQRELMHKLHDGLRIARGRTAA